MGDASQLNQRRRRRSALRAAGLGLLFAAGCDEYVGCAPVLTTEAGQLELHDQVVTVGACRRLRAPAPLVEGARWCPAVQCHPDVPGCENDDDEKLPDEVVAACFETTLSGPVEAEDPCLRMTGPGQAVWTFTARDCPARDVGYAPEDDRYAWSIVAWEEVDAHFESPGDAFARDGLVDGNGDPLPTEDALAPGDVAQVLADVEVPLAVVLRHPEHDAAVGWNPEDWDAAVTDSSGGDVAVRWEPSGVAWVRADAAAQGTVVVSRSDDPSRTWTVGTVRGVAEANLVELEVVVGHAPPQGEDGEGPPGPPAGARAVLRTGDGTPVYGAPVRWTVTDGALPLWRDETMPWTGDYVALAERDGAACHDAPDQTLELEAAVEARFGPLSDRATMTWIVEPPDAGLLQGLAELFGRGPEPPPQSERCAGPGFDELGGCGGCRQGSGGAPALLLLPLWWLFRRRPWQPAQA